MLSAERQEARLHEAIATNHDLIADMIEAKAECERVLHGMRAPRGIMLGVCLGSLLWASIAGLWWLLR